jgi:hypothetical protein
VKTSCAVASACFGLIWFALQSCLPQAGRAQPPGAVQAAPVRPATTAPPATASPLALPLPLAQAGQARYLAIGGGGTPEYTEVSLEQDMQLAREVLPGPGIILFAGGAEAASVRILDPHADDKSLLARLGELFAPRIGRGSQYRPTTLPAAAATSVNVEGALVEALRSGQGPLLVYVAAHGEQGQDARDNHVALWAGDSLSVERLAQLHEQQRGRTLRLVVASCFSGGFGELAFRQADPSKGATLAPRCGVFAGPWDRQTSGCDPNPDRRAQEGYSLHLLQALRGRDRDGLPLPAAALDFDADGRVSLLEAHTRARIASNSIDVPTTTSERFLRQVEHRSGNPAQAGLPEDHAVVAQLGAKLGLPDLVSAERRWKELGAQLDALDQRLSVADDALARVQAHLSAELLGRWPVLDDPYHGDFAAVLQRHAATIQQVLDRSPNAREYTRAQAQVEALDAQLRELEPKEAGVLRLIRAHETLSLAAALKARGGASYDSYRALLACERAGP